jgi:hypothetical protein
VLGANVTSPGSDVRTLAAVTDSAPAPPAARGRWAQRLRGARFHVVVTGECLWVIARHLLGGRPSITRIAAEVKELWALNKERIHTGNPDVLPAGTWLRLR